MTVVRVFVVITAVVVGNAVVVLVASVGGLRFGRRRRGIPSFPRGQVSSKAVERRCRIIVSTVERRRRVTVTAMTVFRPRVHYGITKTRRHIGSFVLRNGSRQHGYVVAIVRSVDRFGDGEFSSVG